MLSNILHWFIIWTFRNPEWSSINIQQFNIPLIHLLFPSLFPPFLYKSLSSLWHLHLYLTLHLSFPITLTHNLTHYSINVHYWTIEQFTRKPLLSRFPYLFRCWLSKHRLIELQCFIINPFELHSILITSQCGHMSEEVPKQYLSLLSVLSCKSLMNMPYLVYLLTRRDHLITASCH
jgi:hypothetical protein